MALWIILCPLIIFFNSFFIGKIYKRLNQFLSSYQTTFYGFLTYFGIFSLNFIILFLFNTSFGLILLFFLIIQAILIIIYLYNFRNLFITYRINYKLLSLLILFVLIAIAFYFIMIDYKSNNIEWLSTYDQKFLEYYKSKILNKPIDTNIIFAFNQNHYLDDFNYIFGSIFVYFFKINLNEINYFNKYINFIILIFSLGLLIVNIYNQWFNNKKGYLVSLLLFSFICIIINWFYQYFYIITFTLTLIFLHSNKQNEIKTNMLITLINWCVFSGCFFDINFLLCAVIINLIQIFISYIQKKENATNYNVLILFSSLLLIATIFDNKNYISFILILIILIIYIVYLFYRSSNLSNKINYHIDQFLYKKIYMIIFIFIIIIWILALILFFKFNNFDFDVKPWFLINDRKNKIIFWLTNIIFWLVNISILIYSFIFNDFWKNKNLSQKKYFQNDLTLLLIILFWNPISINFFNILNNSHLIYINFNLQIIFFSVLIPIIINKIKLFSIRQLTKNDYVSNIGIILITLTVALININLGA